MGSSELAFDADLLLEKYKPGFAMAYGLGVFQQEGYEKGDKPMIDIVLAVDDTEDWHEDNLQNNPNEYSVLARALGSGFINWLQEECINRCI